MKKNLFIAFAAIALACLVSSCGMLNTEQSYAASDLMGLWVEDGTQAYTRFMGTKDDTGEYYIGCEWDEADDKHEEDLIYMGNGYFKWKLVVTQLTEIHLMDNGGSNIPKVYTITTLTSGTLVYKDDAGVRKTFSKVVTTK